jgi:hypothetical protein
MIQRSLATGFVAMCFLAPAAQAAVVSVNFSASPVAVPNDIDGVYFNFLTGVYGSAEMPGFDFNPYNNNAGLTFYGNASPSGILATGTPGTNAQAQSLAFGALISSTGQYNQYQTRGDTFHGGGQSYVGLRFLNEVTGIVNYGWALMSSSAGDGFPATVLGYGYENTGLSITAGQMSSVSAVPESDSIALFGLGLAALAGVQARRRRKSN